MEISHEVPICLLEESRSFNDYDYALVHLFETHPKYYKYYKQSVRDGRKVLLDNSIFELGESFETKRFVYWIDKLEPTHYIIPDTLEDNVKTLIQANSWFKKYKDLPGKKIGVVQGKTMHELLQCYVKLDELGVDEIAISFDYSFYEKLFPHYNKLVSWTMGRSLLINQLIDLDIVNRDKPHHLLGCALAWEFSLYKYPRYDFLTSLDTSNPITLSLDNQKYEDFPLMLHKPVKKLFESIDYLMTPREYSLVIENTLKFRKFVNR